MEIPAIVTELPPNLFLEDEFFELVSFVNSDYPDHRLVWLFDSNTYNFCSGKLKDLPFTGRSMEIILDPGEGSKTLDGVHKVIGSMLNAGLDRKTLLIAVGGGMICDLGGFVASVFKRGVPFILLPTTLLAMVDASTGGKTGVNFEGLKNQIGLFSLPKAIFSFRQFLDTLPEREYWAGKAEMLKHSLISANSDISESLERLSSRLSIDDIKRSTSIKKDIVRHDILEEGLRKQLNFGHTVGHALETWSHLPQNEILLHGEAVAWGIVGELYMSTSYGLEISVYESVRHFVIEHFPKPVLINSDLEMVMQFMLADKKNDFGRIGFVMLKRLGEPIEDVYVEEDDIRRSLKTAFEM